MNLGKFIVFEGIDGSGKTTQAKMLCDKLNLHDKESVFTAEPTNRSCGKLLRSFLKGEETASDITVASLFTTDRLDHITCNGGLLDTINCSKNVICDRYYFSSYAYNAHSRDVQEIINLNSICSSILRPDVCIFIDISPEVAMERIITNRSADSREIYETTEYLTIVRKRYYQAFELTKNEENVIIIDGNRDVDAISKDVFDAVNKLF